MDFHTLMKIPTTLIGLNIFKKRKREEHKSFAQKTAYEQGRNCMAGLIKTDYTGTQNSQTLKKRLPKGKENRKPEDKVNINLKC